jgi:two-component system, OmpR family, response regulator CpxR
VLCVTDDPWLLGITAAMLERKGYNVLAATSRHDALEVFVRSMVDLVVVDYEMHYKEGHEVATKIKILDPQVPVALQSGAVDFPEALAKTTDAILPKGSDLRLLEKVVAKLMINRGSNGHRKSLNATNGHASFTAPQVPADDRSSFEIRRRHRCTA